MTPCGECRFWRRCDAEPRDPFYGIGSCCIRAPTCTGRPNEALPLAMWPTTSAEQWCGEGEPKVGKNAADA